MAQLLVVRLLVAVMGQSLLLFNILKWAGAAYLVWLAISALRSPPPQPPVVAEGSVRAVAGACPVSQPCSTRSACAMAGAMGGSGADSSTERRSGSRAPERAPGLEPSQQQMVIEHPSAVAEDVECLVIQDPAILYRHIASVP